MCVKVIHSHKTSLETQIYYTKSYNDPTASSGETFSLLDYMFNVPRAAVTKICWNGITLSSHSNFSFVWYKHSPFCMPLYYHKQWFFHSNDLIYTAL